MRLHMSAVEQQLSGWTTRGSQRLGGLAAEACPAHHLLDRGKGRAIAGLPRLDDLLRLLPRQPLLAAGLGLQHAVPGAPVDVEHIERPHQDAMVPGVADDLRGA